MSGKKGMVHYSLATKLEAVRLHEEGLPYRVIAEKLGIRDSQRSRNGWLGTELKAKLG